MIEKEYLPTFVSEKIALLQVLQRVSQSWPLIGQWLDLKASNWSMSLPSTAPAIRVTRNCPP